MMTNKSYEAARRRNLELTKVQGERNRRDARRSYDPAAKGEAAGRADNARTERHERFATALGRFEDAATALNAAWHDGVPEAVVEASYPFGETTLDEVVRRIAHFRAGVDAAPYR